MAHSSKAITGKAATAGPAIEVLEDEGRLSRNSLRSSAGYWLRAWRRFRQNKLSLVALTVVCLVIVFALVAPLISRHVTHYTYAENHLPQKLTPPFSSDYYLGADGNGRDVLTRLAYGGRISLMIAALGSLGLLLLGGSFGAIAGYAGGISDTVLMRLADVILCIPSLPLLILVSSLYDPPPATLALFIAAFGWPGVSRLVRGEVLRLRHQDFIEASRVLGASNVRIVLRHIFPNVVPIIVVWASLVVPALILVEASLSYLGVGVKVPNPSWGNMLQDAKGFYYQAWWLTFIPGFMIYITVLGINLVGSGLRDALDPRLNN
jgi:peptide/nickel transport system permease protein